MSMEELSKALTDYYDPRTDLPRKQHLHEELNRFLIDQQSWRIALSAFQQQQQQNATTLHMPPVLIYFLLQVLEHSIRHRYGDQQQIRQILLWFVLQLFDTMPAYVRSKLSLLIVQIARCDYQWSTEEYFQTCYHLIHSQPLPGLVLLTTTIEELGQLNEDCTIKRCQQLKTALNQQASQMIHILHTLLRNDPPQCKEAITCGNRVLSTERKATRLALAPSLVKQQVLIGLDRLINRLTNLPLPSELIDDLFHYASATWSVEAFNCVHELILKQHVPRVFDPILHSTLRRMTQLIMMINENSSNIPSRNKITEILRAMFSLHLKRCESLENFPLFELLTGLYQYTLQQTSQDGFYACLDIWSIFIDYLKAKDESRLISKDNSFDRYAQLLRSLSQDLLQRVQQGHSIAETLEETTDLTDTKTATERYIRECIDLLSKLADLPLLSSSILHSLINLLQPDIEQFKNIQKFVEISPQDPSRHRLSFNQESLPICRQLLQRLSNLLRAFASLASICLLDYSNHSQQDTIFHTHLTLAHQFAQLVVYLVHVRFDAIEYSPAQIHQEFLNVQSRPFECVISLTPWLGQMLMIRNAIPDDRRMIHELITQIIDVCAPLVNMNNSDQPIALSAASLLFAIVPSTRQHLAIDQLNSIKHFTHGILQWNVILDNSTRFQLYKLAIKIISSYILIDASTAEQFLRTVFQPLNTLLSDPTNFFNGQHDRHLLRRTFLDYTLLLTELIESIRTENTKLRQNLFAAIQSIILQFNRFLPSMINRDTECETAVISLLLISFDLLRTQMGSDLIQTILQSTFAAFNIDNVRHVLHEAKPKAHTAVSRFLEFLALLVNEPVNQKFTQQFLPMIIDLCTTALYPAIRENFQLDARENYYKLVQNLLLNNWRYFFKGTVLTTLNGDAETTANEQSFTQLMESLAWSFSQADIEQFRVNLTSCNELQSKCGLYTKSIFRQQMSPALLSLLLTVLLVRSHELCRDDIISTLFSILINDNANNFAQFIHTYLAQSNIQALLNEKHRRVLAENYGRNETDLPSFTQNLNDFIHDYRHYTTTTNAA